MRRSLRTRRSRADEQQVDDVTGVTAATAGAGAAPSAAADDRRRKRARPDTASASASASSAHSGAATSLPVVPASADDAALVTLTVADGITVQVQPMTVSPRRNPRRTDRLAGTGNAVLNPSSHFFQYCDAVVLPIRSTTMRSVHGVRRSWTSGARLCSATDICCSTVWCLAPR